MEKDDSEARIRLAILQYVAEHPQAFDNVDGILRWWLKDDLCLTPRATLEPILQGLVEQGILERRPVPNGGAVYRACRQK